MQSKVSEINTYQLGLGNISRDTVENIKKTGLNGYLCEFPVADKNLDIHKYLQRNFLGYLHYIIW